MRKPATSPRMKKAPTRAPIDLCHVPSSLRHAERPHRGVAGFERLEENPRIPFGEGPTEDIVVLMLGACAGCESDIERCHPSHTQQCQSKRTTQCDEC